MKVKVILLVSIYLISISNCLAQSEERITLSGKITDFYTGKPLYGVSIYVETLKRGTTTDQQGEYEINLPKGRFLVTYSRAELKKEFLILDLITDKEVNIEMKESVFNLDEVAVFAQKKDANVTNLEIGKNELGIEKLQSIPAFLGEADVVKSIILLPGVSNVGEGSSGFNVRGGSVDQNLIIQDEGIIFNPSHLFGFFSIFNPSLVEKAEIYKNGIPAKFGGRLSSVLDVKLREGDFREYKAKGGIGFASSNLSIEGPIINEKVSFNVGGRASYVGALLGLIDNPNLNTSAASFYDTNFKSSWLINDNNKLSVSSYLSRDYFKFASDTSFSWQTFNNSLLWNSILGDKLAMDLSLSHGQYQYDIEDAEGLNSFLLQSEINYNRLFSNFTYDINESNILEFGSEVIQYNFFPGKISPLNQSSGIVQREVEQETSIESSVFAEMEYNVTDNLAIKGGLRYSHFFNLGPGTDLIFEEGQPRSVNTITDTINYNSNEIIVDYGGLEPRLVLNYKINDRNSIKASYNRTRQYIHLITNTASVTPIDNWKTSNRYIRPEYGDQFSLGLFRNFNENDYETSLEVYYKKLNDIVEFKNGAVLLMNENIETELINGIGQAYGVELFINKKRGLLTGWVGYTYSRSLRQVNGPFASETINNGAWYPSNFDKPHDFTAALNYKSSPLVEFGFNFTYSSGRPNTVPLALYNISNITNVYSYSDRNSDRIPDYHRLDLSMTIKSKPKEDRNWRTSWILGIYNVYGRNNTYSIYYDNEFGSPPSAYKLSVLGSAFPSLTFNFEFL